MVSKVRIIWKQTVAQATRAERVAALRETVEGVVTTGAKASSSVDGEQRRPELEPGLAALQQALQHAVAEEEKLADEEC